MTEKKQKGFSLVELSMVLVIIGLVLGTVLVAQNLIEAAKIRSVSADLSRVKTAVNSFADKFNYVPGDFPYASQYWTDAVDGNGNGTFDVSEEGNIFDHLKRNNLIEDAISYYGSIGFINSSYEGAVYATSHSSIPVTLPNTIDGGAVYISTALPLLFVTEESLTHYGVITAGKLAPESLRSLDIKMDNGNPITGTLGGLCHITDGTEAQSPCFCININAPWNDQSSTRGSVYEAEYDVSGARTLGCHFVFWAFGHAYGGWYTKSE